MAVDMAGRRQEGVSQIPADKWKGSVGKDESGSAIGGEANLPTTSIDVTTHAPSAGRVNRGVEPNTNKAEGANVSDPSYDTEPAGPVPRGEPFNTPDSSARISTDPSHSDWDDQGGSRADSAANHSRPIAMDQLSTFNMIGESPQGECDGDES